MALEKEWLFEITTKPIGINFVKSKDKNFKTKPCSEFHNPPFICKYGHRCSFVHNKPSYFDDNLIDFFISGQKYRVATDCINNVGFNNFTE